jgi:hypothetical protein
MYLRKSAKNNWVRKSQNIYGLQIANPQIVTLAESPEIKKKIKSANLRICGFICGPPIVDH